MLVIDSKELLKSLKKIRPVCGSNITYPVLSFVKISKKPGSEFGEVSGTNLKVSIVEKVSFSGSGEFLLPLTELMNACSVSDGLMDLSPSKVICGKDKYTMGSPEDIANFPNIDTEIDGEEISVDDTFIWSLINASRTTQNKPEVAMGNVRILNLDGILGVYGTDGNSFYKNVFPSPGGPVAFESLIPNDTVKCLSGLTGDFKITAGKDKILITNGTTSIIGTLFDGQKYPNVDQLLKPREETIFSVDRAALVSCLNKITSVYSALPICQLQFDEPDRMIFYLNNSDFNQEAKTELDVTHGIEFDSITINARSLLDLLQLLPTEVHKVNLHLHSAQKPIIIKAEGTDTVIAIGALQNPPRG